jgi:hypothetical protein
VKRQLWKVRDKRRFLMAAMEELAGNAHISFEGNLSALGMVHLPGATDEETPVLRRNTLRPRQDFVILPLETDFIPGIGAAIGGTLPRSIIHIQIEKMGRLELGLYDNFNVRGIFFGPALAPIFVGRMQTNGLLIEWMER